MAEMYNDTNYAQTDHNYERRRKVRNDIYERVSSKLAAIMSQRHMKQTDIEELCRKNGYPITQAAVSKIVAYKDNYSITLGDFLQVCKALDVSPAKVLESDETYEIGSVHTDDVSPAASRSPLIIKPSEDEFNGYCNKYHCYFFSTISSEGGLLHGELVFSKSELDDYCEATFKLDTNKTNEKGEKVYKEYSGRLVISPRMSSCYCILENKRIGELCFIVFRHLYLNNESLKCRLAVAATASAGDNRRPTIHRILISQTEVSGETLEMLKAQLRLNSSELIISRTSIEKLSKLNDDEFPSQVTGLFDTAIQKEEYYRFPESQLRSLDMPLRKKLQAICMLRNESVSPKYNKVGSKADEIIFDIISSSTKSAK